MKKRKGASSVLVLFMVVILVTLALFTIVSTRLNYKLSEKASEWNSKYYYLDGKAEEHLAEVATLINVAEKEAIDTFLLEKTNSEEYSNYNVYEIYDILNYYFKDILATKLQDKVDDNIEKNKTYISVERDIFNNVETLKYGYTIFYDDSKDFGLQVEVEIKNLLYDVYLDGDIITAEKVFYENRYDIKKWKQFQEVQEEKENTIWDPRETFDSK